MYGIYAIFAIGRYLTLSYVILRFLTFLYVGLRFLTLSYVFLRFRVLLRCLGATSFFMNSMSEVQVFVCVCGGLQGLWPLTSICSIFPSALKGFIWALGSSLGWQTFWAALPFGVRSVGYELMDHRVNASRAAMDRARGPKFS